MKYKAVFVGLGVFIYGIIGAGEGPGNAKGTSFLSYERMHQQDDAQNDEEFQEQHASQRKQHQHSAIKKRKNKDKRQMITAEDCDITMPACDIKPEDLESGESDIWSTRTLWALKEETSPPIPLLADLLPRIPPCNIDDNSDIEACIKYIRRLPISKCEQQRVTDICASNIALRDEYNIKISVRKNMNNYVKNLENIIINRDDDTEHERESIIGDEGGWHKYAAERCSKEYYGRMAFLFDEDEKERNNLIDQVAHKLSYYFYPYSHDENISLEELFKTYPRDDIYGDIERALQEHSLFQYPYYIDNTSIECMSAQEIYYHVMNVINRYTLSPEDLIYFKEKIASRSRGCETVNNRSLYGYLDWVVSLFLDEDEYLKDLYPQYYEQYAGTSAHDIPSEVLRKMVLIAQDYDCDSRFDDSDMVAIPSDQSSEHDEITFAQEYFKGKTDRERQYYLNHHYKGSYHKAAQDAARIAHIQVKKHDRNSARKKKSLARLQHNDINH